ncbi:MAG: ABC transporter permease [Pseudochelatococcus sp.]|jgi:peptide/nickel transport system permease protein|uniref:ABC transporter permease n=1 Tax=Pseudochelatococcus sp. TaxID=2020869 RepID=UPI003D8DFD9E
MAFYIARRLGQALFVLWAAFSVSFLILYVLPSDPVTIMLNKGEQSMVDQAQIDLLRAEYFLDQPFLMQYAHALSRAVAFDLGNSIQSGKPVVALLAEAVPQTALLAAISLILSVVVGVGLALAASVARSARWQSLLFSLPSVGVSLPTFWIGLLLLQAFSFNLPLFPAIGNDGWRSLVLPAITLSVPTGAKLAQVLARSLQGVWRQPFIDAIRSRGLTRLRLLFVHVLPNAAIPVLSLTGVLTGNLLAGSVVTETVFSRDGIGRLAEGAVHTQDIPVVQGVVVLAAIVFVAVNLLVDLLYPVLDPRIRHLKSGGAA